MKSALRLAVFVSHGALRDQEAAILDRAGPQGCSILYILVFGHTRRLAIAASALLAGLTRMLTLCLRR